MKLARKISILAAPSLAIALAPSVAHAQASPLTEGFVVGEWTFRPSIELRVRGEWTRRPSDTGGESFDTTAVLGEGIDSGLPAVSQTAQPPVVKNQYLFHERSRLGLGVDHAGTLSAQLTLQDARVWGEPDFVATGPGEPTLPSFQPLDAYVDLHMKEHDKLFVRLGRQRVTWGEGRLVGENDWSTTARALDAARVGFQLGDFDFQLMGAMLAAPGALPPSASGTAEPAPEGTGAQLYGGDIVWHLFPLLRFEATGVARVVREPVPITLTPGDTYVMDGRVFGEHRGFRYSLEGAYELGREATFGGYQQLGSGALAADTSLETALPWHLTFAAEGAYATGDSGDPTQKQKRFDPILPNEHAVDPHATIDPDGPLSLMDSASSLSPMGLVAWSNLVDVGGGIGARPFDELEIVASYRNLNLANAKGRWTSSSLVPIGSSTANTSKALGNEIDVAARLSVWSPLSFEAGYGVFLAGAAAKQILLDVQRASSDEPASAQHWLYVQATLRAP